MIPRHIQDYDTAERLEPHWGYHPRVMPCTNDAGSCEYLELVYESHDRGMLYAGIMYAALGGILLLWAAWASFGLGLGRSRSALPRFQAAMGAWIRRHTLRNAPLTWLFGHTTRLQLLLLAGLVAYLTVFSFVGMTYQKWVTPVKNMPGVYNTRTSLGVFADRIGIFAYALTPISILLASRESILSAATGVPYHHFNFLHRWVGHIIMIQSVVHTIGWTVVEVKLYQPQPKVAREWIVQTYMVWGCVALILLLLLWGLSTSWARRAFGYEFFRKAHWVLAMVYIGACWAHWAQLKCFMIPALVLWGVDRGVRLLRTGLIHYRILGGGHGAFTSFPARVSHYGSDVVRLDIDVPEDIAHAIGQHFYLTFPAGSIWQAHPFTPLSLPGESHAYLIRAKRGETSKLTAFAGESTPVILTGPYGGDITRALAPTTNVLCIAGGTGITFVLPVLLLLAQHPPAAHIQLVWSVRAARDVEWVAPELARLRASHISVIVHHTRDDPSEEAAVETPGGEEKPLTVVPGRPNTGAAVRDFLKRVAGPSKVFVSGPAGMVTDVRNTVAGCNEASKVWRGEDEADVDLVFDERLE